ncbi:MAG: hypothetical protein KIT72_01100 [Polyangiaceae bacterium]|nr:hypothetical protein [Polyangiaceae bacterium]MCW5788992.1 hypothetical protein [Polyangiaceae bacterium]
MLTPDVRLDGFSTRDWTRLAQALRPAGEPPPRDPGARSGGVVVVTLGGRPVKLVSTHTGRVKLAPGVARSDGAGLAKLDWPVSLDSLAAALGARWAVELAWGALDELVSTWSGRLTPEQDAFDQVVELLRVAQELEAAGKLRAHPFKLASLPLPSPRVKERAFEAVCPAGKSLLFGVFHQGALYTAVALRRQARGIDWILGPEYLRTDMGLVSGDWTRDYRHLSRAVEERLGPIAVGCFGELTTFQRLSEPGAGGAFATAVAARDVVLAPVVPALAIPLGLDAGRAAFIAIRGLAERMGAGSWFGEEGPLGPTIDRVRSAIEGRDAVALLGFDPIRLLRRLLARRSR